MKQSVSRWVYIYWKDLYISKFKYNTKEGLYLCGKKFVEKNIRENKSIALQINVFNIFMEQIYNRKINKLAIRRSDHQIVFQSIMALLIFKQYEEDNLLWFPPIYKRLRTNQNLHKISPS